MGHTDEQVADKTMKKHFIRSQEGTDMLHTSFTIVTHIIVQAIITAKKNERERCAKETENYTRNILFTELDLLTIDEAVKIREVHRKEIAKVIRQLE